MTDREKLNFIRFTMYDYKAQSYDVAVKNLAYVLDALLPQEKYEDFCKLPYGKADQLLSLPCGKHTLDITEQDTEKFDAPVCMVSLRDHSAPEVPLWGVPVGGSAATNVVRAMHAGKLSREKFIQTTASSIRHYDDPVRSILTNLTRDTQKEGAQAEVYKREQSEKAEQLMHHTSDATKKVYTIELDDTEKSCVDDMLYDNLNYWIGETMNPAEYAGEIRAGISLLKGLGHADWAENFKAAAQEAMGMTDTLKEKHKDIEH